MGSSAECLTVCRGYAICSVICARLHDDWSQKTRVSYDGVQCSGGAWYWGAVGELHDIQSGAVQSSGGCIALSYNITGNRWYIMGVGPMKCLVEAAWHMVSSTVDI